MPRPTDAEWPVLVQSVREHLRFDQHRREGHPDEALKVARAEKQAADASGVAAARDLKVVELRERMNFALLEATIASADRDLVSLETSLEKLRAETPTPLIESTALYVEQMLLYASNRLPELLVLVDGALARGTSTSEERHRLLISRLQ